MQRVGRVLPADYASFIDERVLWIRSDKPLHQRLDFAGIAALNPTAAGRRVPGGPVLADMTRHAAWYVGVAAVLAGLLFKSRSLKRLLHEAGEVAGRKSCAAIAPTWQAVSLSLLLAARWPLVFGMAPWRIRELSGESAFLHSLGVSLAFACVVGAARAD